MVCLCLSSTVGGDSKTRGSPADVRGVVLACCALASQWEGTMGRTTCADPASSTHGTSTTLSPTIQPHGALRHDASTDCMTSGIEYKTSEDVSHDDASLTRGGVVTLVNGDVSGTESKGCDDGQGSRLVTLSELPVDLLGAILGFCDFATRLEVTKTCHSLRIATMQASYTSLSFPLVSFRPRLASRILHYAASTVQELTVPPLKEDVPALGGGYGGGHGGASSTPSSTMVALPDVVAPSFVGYPNLRVLNAASARLSSTTFKSMLFSMPALEELDLGKCGKGVDDSVMQVLAQRCPRLRRVSIARCPNVTGAGLQYLATLPLEHLDITRTRIKAAEVATLVAKLPTLQSLVAVGTKFTDATVVALATSCPGLQVLDISSTDTFQPSTSVTNVSMDAVAKHCVSLRELRVRGHGVSTNGIRAIAEGCKSLQVMDAQGCAGVEDDALAALSSLGQLRELRLLRCKSVTDKGIDALAACKSLNLLDLGGCVALTLDGIMSVISQLPALRNIFLGGIPATEAVDDILAATDVILPKRLSVSLR